MKATATGSQTANYYYYQNDHLGTPMKLTNQSGVVVWSATYDAFGRATVDAASTITNNLRYPGQYADAETGLHYNWNRYYDPVNGGRYVSSDPIRLLGSINFYTYVGSNPLMAIDPTGLVKVHGNWCGPDWTGGRTHPYVPVSPKYYKEPIDKLDAACETHDVCYFKCRENNSCDKQKRKQCFLICDKVLTKSAYEIGGFMGYLVGGGININDPDSEANGASCKHCGAK
jgi:RHS repeat-associated protein